MTSEKLPLGKSSLRVLLFLFISFPVAFIHGQFAPVPVHVYAYGNGTLTWGSGISFFDFNKDGWDDITVCDTGFPVKFYQNNQDDSFTYVGSVPNTFSAKHPVWVDFDNDHDYDLFITFQTHSCKLYRNNGDLTSMEDISTQLDLPAPDGNSYGCSWGDYDKDGFLDVYICNFNQNNDYVNWLLHNNGDGTFTNVTWELNVGLDQFTSFQSTWIDLDGNGWQDLYVVNDHFFPAAMFMNDGSSLVNQAESMGLDAQLLGMSNSAADYDNDGDFDFYLSNGIDGNFLLRNDNMEFSNVAPVNGSAIYSVCWNSSWFDMENDGMQDLFVCTNNYLEHNRLLKNLGNGNFTESNLPLPTAYNDCYTAAIGDYNRDGLADLVTYSFNPTLITLYKNTNIGANNWIKLSTTGVMSNADGIGTRLTLFCGDDTYTHYTFCGTNYLSQDSQHRIIGLGTHALVDSLYVTWPSGIVDRHYALSVNQEIHLTEGETYGAELILVAAHLCPASSLELNAGEWASYLWPDGSTGPTFQVANPGHYTVELTDTNGFKTNIIFEVTNLPHLLWEIVISDPACVMEPSGHIQLIAEENAISEIYWNGQLGTSLLENLTAGLYHYQIIDVNGCSYSGDVELNNPPPILIDLMLPQPCFGVMSHVNANVSGGTGELQLDWHGADPFWIGDGNYLLTVTDENNCVVEETFTIEEYEPIEVTVNTPLACYGMSVEAQTYIQGGSGIYIENWNGVDPHALFAGEYTLSVMDDAGCTGAATFTVSQSTEIVLEATVTNAYQGANGSIDVTVSGGYAPYTYLWSNNSTDEDLNNIGQGIHTIQVSDALGCTASLDITVTDLMVTEDSNHVMMVWPNPSSGQFTVLTQEAVSIQVVDTMGRLVLQDIALSRLHKLNMANAAPGVYYLIAGRNSRSIMLLP